MLGLIRFIEGSLFTYVNGYVLSTNVLLNKGQGEYSQQVFSSLSVGLNPFLVLKH